MLRRVQDYNICHVFFGVSIGVGIVALTTQIYNYNVYVANLEDNPFFSKVFTPDYHVPKLEYLSDFRAHRNLIQITYKNIIGSSTSLECYKDKVLGIDSDVCYNCLGWSMWEREWLMLPRIKYSGKDNLVKAAKDFIDIHSKVTKDFTLGEKIFPSFQEADCARPAHNMIAFYFECYGPEYLSCRWTHAARFLSKVSINQESREANLWTSKDGLFYLLSHEELSDLSSLYGETFICLAPEEAT